MPNLHIIRSGTHAVRRLALLAAAAALGSSCGKEPEAPRAGATAYDQQGHLLRRPSRRTTRPNLVVIVVDTLRADALAGPGEPGGAMPWLSSLAGRGTRFTNATTAAPWTLPALASLFSGLLPSVHGCTGDTGLTQLAEAWTTFAEILENGCGYDTAAFVGGPWSARPGSIFQGFGRVVPNFGLQGMEAMVKPWARAREPSRPFFLLLHTYDAHDPYGAEDHPFPPPPPGARRDEGDPIAALGSSPSGRDLAVLYLTDLAARDAIVGMHFDLYMGEMARYLWNGLKDEERPGVAKELHAAYLEGVRWTDGLLRDAVASLEAWGLLENTLLVITADHGEAFGEHGILMHGRQVYDELVRIPLVVSGLPPFTGGRRVEASVGLVDVLPTFLDVAGLEPLEGIEGRSFMGLVEPGRLGHPVTSEEWVSPTKTGNSADAFTSSVRSERWKFVATYDKLGGTVREEVYDLVADPGEQRDLADGEGRLGAMTFDEAFCVDVERVRDRVWAVVADTRARLGNGSTAGQAPITAQRPPPVCAPQGPR